MVSAVCRAKDPSKCSYHGAVIKMNEAQRAGDFEAYFTNRKKVEEQEAQGWSEETLSEKLSPVVDTTPRETSYASSTDPRVQAGEVLDRVSYTDESGNTTFFRRSTEDTLPVEPYYIRVQFKKPLSKEDIEKYAMSLGYAYRVNVRGEGLDWPTQDSPYSFIVHADTTKSRRSSIPHALDDLEKGYRNVLTTGSASPIPGSKANIEPLDPNSENAVEFYYDNVEDK